MSVAESYVEQQKLFKSFPALRKYREVYEAYYKAFYDKLPSQTEGFHFDTQSTHNYQLDTMKNFKAAAIPAAPAPVQAPAATAQPGAQPGAQALSADKPNNDRQKEITKGLFAIVSDKTNVDGHRIHHDGPGDSIVFAKGSDLYIGPVSSPRELTLDYSHGPNTVLVKYKAPNPADDFAQDWSVGFWLLVNNSGKDGINFLKAVIRGELPSFNNVITDKDFKVANEFFRKLQISKYKNAGADSDNVEYVKQSLKLIGAHATDVANKKATAQPIHQVVNTVGTGLRSNAIIAGEIAAGNDAPELRRKMRKIYEDQQAQQHNLTKWKALY